MAIDDLLLLLEKYLYSNVVELRDALVTQSDGVYMIECLPVFVRGVHEHFGQCSKSDY